MGTRPRRGASDGYHPERCQEGAMTTARARVQFRLAGALLGAVMLLVAACSAGGGGSPKADPAGTARAAVAVSSPGRAIAGRTAGPISGRRGSGARIAGAPAPPPC